MTKTITIWRLEAADGEGPFRAGHAPDGAYDPPGPYGDHRLRGWWANLVETDRHEAYRFGFRDLGQYQRWFTADLRANAASNRCTRWSRRGQFKKRWHLYEYVVLPQHLIEGQWQVAFAYHEAARTGQVLAADYCD